MVPTFVPFTRHWYVGDVPPLVGVAVNVTLDPSHILLSASLDAILTLAGKFGFTVVVMPLEVAGDPVKQGLALDVITTVTTCPLVNDDVVKVALFVPVFVPFTRH